MKASIALALAMISALVSCTSHETETTSAPLDGGVISLTSTGFTPTCHPTCATAADCGTPGDPLYAPSHFACQAGLCEWQGCKAASECSAEAGGGSFLCQRAMGSPIPVCVPACQRPSDCVAPGNTSPLEDANHFACTAGACVWRGCASTAECSSALRTPKVACEAAPGDPAPTCVPTCTAASDCAVPGQGVLGDASHYTCQGGRCQWLGCKSTTECVQALQSSKYVCQ